ncbi:terminase small subunit [Streptococcus mitis]|nr:terminase small subunit [Streptococcus sp. NLN64]
MIAKLTIKQQKFVDEYLISGNATEAYKLAYPNVKNDSTAQANSSRLLSNAKVKAYKDERLAELKSETIADQKEVMEFLTAVMRGEVTEPLLVLDGEGYQKVIEAKPNVSTRRSAAVDIGKRYGMWTEKKEIEHKGEVAFVDDIS